MDVVRGPDATTRIRGPSPAQQIRSAYGVTTLPNQGAGMTIGIVDVYNEPTTTNDISVFSTQYGLPSSTASTATGRSSSLASRGPRIRRSGVTTDTSGETALDVEWAHALAPFANIVLDEVNARTARPTRL